MYAKLFSSLLSSSVWSEDSDTCKVWITLIALADREGFVFGSPSGIARICALSVEKVETAIEKFLSSDKHSSDKTREPERDGRRIETVDGGWVLLNYAHYRDLSDAEIRRAQYRASKRKIRGQSTNVNTVPQSSTEVHLSESSSEAEPDTKEKRERGRFAPPTLEDVVGYGKEMPGLNASAFHDFYSSKGWKIGSSSMKDWRAAARRWRQRDMEDGKVSHVSVEKETARKAQGEEDAEAQRRVTRSIKKGEEQRIEYQRLLATDKAAAAEFREKVMAETEDDE